ncbi:hypothetical protein GN958_ATG19612 [Phytophthora infestans]|nr:hypothetical protein GN958_ATG19612 [Phytophthora infestans]
MANPTDKINKVLLSKIPEGKVHVIVVAPPLLSESVKNALATLFGARAAEDLISDELTLKKRKVNPIPAVHSATVRSRACDQGSSSFSYPRQFLTVGVHGLFTSPRTPGS